MKSFITVSRAVLLLLVALGASRVAMAARALDRMIAPPVAATRPGPEHAPLNQHFDGRFGHNQYYLNPGYRPPQAPHAGVPVIRGSDRFHYDHGHWYRRDGIGWVVVPAPIGALVPVLPPAYTTVWFGGMPYYYANDTYYTWSSPLSQYQVVEPPPGIETEGAATAPYADYSLFVYPEHGQSAQQQNSDEYDCYRFASQQTGFDPTRAGGGVPESESTTKHGDYLRTDSECLTGRGYGVN
jgi:hypothetical protein